MGDLGGVEVDGKDREDVGENESAIHLVCLGFTPYRFVRCCGVRRP